MNPYTSNQIWSPANIDSNLIDSRALERSDSPAMTEAQHIFASSLSHHHHSQQHHLQSSSPNNYHHSNGYYPDYLSPPINMQQLVRNIVNSKYVNNTYWFDFLGQYD